MPDDASKTSGPTLTTKTGAPIADQKNSQTAGPRGPLLMQDTQLLEQMQHFNRERIPERVVHAKGSGAYGEFVVTNDVARYTKAAFLSEVGKRSEAFVRFSTVAGERGAADAERDVRGFSVRIYTEEGNWDLVGNNTPVFFLRDPLKFASFIHSQKRHPRTNLRDQDVQWDFWSMSPEALHQVTILKSDRGLPASYRHQHGFGSHTYSMVNAEGERVWVKFHLKSDQGIRTMSDEEAAKVVGEDRESHQKDLYEAIERGDFPSWTLEIQVMTQEQAEAFRWNPFDLTKVWPHAEYPLVEVGRLTLNRNPVDYHAEVEQAAFKPSAMVPGIGPSPDRMLQGRLMSYADAQLYRLGVNHDKLDVNRPRTAVATYTRDGAMASVNPHAHPNYHPNSVAGAPQEAPATRDPAWDLGQAVVDRYDAYADHDDYTQAGDLWRLFDDAHRDRTAARIADGLSQARPEVQERMLAHFYRADDDYGRRVKRALAAAGAPREPVAVPAD